MKSASRRRASIASSHCGTGRQPASVQAIQWWDAARTPAFRAAPMLSELPLTTLTGTRESARQASSSSAVPSVDPPSTTTTSSGALVCAARAMRSSSSPSRSLSVGTTTEMPSSSVRPASPLIPPAYGVTRCLPGGSQLALVVVVHRSVRAALAVAEAQALVEGTGRDVVLAGVEVHEVGAAVARDIEGGLHEGAAEALPPALGDDVQLGQVALERLGPDGGAEAHDGEAVRPVTGEEDREVVLGHEAADALGELVGPRSDVVELGVEVVQEAADGRRVLGLREVDAQRRPARAKKRRGSPVIPPAYEVARRPAIRVPVTLLASGFEDMIFGLTPATASTWRTRSATRAFRATRRASWSSRCAASSFR